MLTKVRALLSVLTSSMLFGVLLSGCSADNIEIPRSEIYNREFLKQVGTFASDHDWNFATQASVTVTSSSLTTVKIYAAYDGETYLFGTYTNVSGTKKLNVDVPKGVRELIVRAGGKTFRTPPGGSINVDAASRAIIENPDPLPGEFKVTYAPLDKQLTVTGQYIAKYAEILPEDGWNMGKEGVEMNFRFKAKAGSKIIIYPVMWTTSKPTNTLGLYYYDKNGDRHEQELYSIKSGPMLRYFNKKADLIQEAETEFMCINGDTKNDVNGGTQPNGFFNAAIDNAVEHQLLVKKESLTDYTAADWRVIQTYMEYQGFVFSAFEAPGKWTDDLENEKATTHLRAKYYKYDGFYNSKDSSANNYSSLADNLDGSNYYISKGIQIEFPEDVEYGLYIKEGNAGNKYYSESYLNPLTDRYYVHPYKDPSVTEITEVKLNYKYHAPYAATFTRNDLNNSTPDIEANQFSRVCFEDEHFDSGKEVDLNDMVFYIDGITDVIPQGDPSDEPELKDNPFTWIVAAEDLGNAADFDFNDVVFGIRNEKVDAQSNDKYITVRALASGGTLPVYLLYNGEVVNANNGYGGEFHSWFDNGFHGSDEVINAHSVTAVGAAFRLKVDPDFTMSVNSHLGEKLTNMGGFTIQVTSNKDGNEYREVTAPIPSLDGAGDAYAPQMICVPAKWAWPTEGTAIHSAYGDPFLDWCKKPSAEHTWYENVVGSVVTRRFGMDGTGEGEGDTSIFEPVEGTVLTAVGEPEQDPNYTSALYVEFGLPDDISDRESFELNVQFVGENAQNFEFQYFADYDWGGGSDWLTLKNNLQNNSDISITDAKVISNIKKYKKIRLHVWFNGATDSDLRCQVVLKN